jgi:hypothetical protein
VNDGEESRRSGSSGVVLLCAFVLLFNELLDQMVTLAVGDSRRRLIHEIEALVSAIMTSEISFYNRL